MTGFTGLSPAYIYRAASELCWPSVRTVICLILCLAAAGAPAATTYRWVDADGVHYSDQPHVGADKVSLGQAQTYSAAPQAPAPVSAPRTRETPFSYSSCAVVQPADDQVLFESEAVTVAVQTVPAKRAGDHVTVSFDGSSLEPASPDQLSFRISPIERGTHTLTAMVSGPAGRVLCQSAPVTFHVRQPSVVAPANPAGRH